MLSVNIVDVTPVLHELDATPGIALNEQFQVDFRFIDSHVSPSQSVFSGYVDVNFDATKLHCDDIVYSSNYASGHTGTIDNVTGLVDEIGATDGITPPPSDIVFSLKFTAIGYGNSNVATDIAEDAGSQIVVFGLDDDQRNFTNYNSLPVNVPPPPPTVQFETTAENFAEDGGGLVLNVQLSSVYTQDVVVPFTLGGTATAGADYTAATSPVTIPAGQTSAGISIVVTDDTLDETDETIVVTLGQPNVGVLGANTTNTATIVDNDAAPTVDFAPAEQSADESVGTMTITAQLSAASGQDVTVPFSVSGSATAGVDYSITASPLTIPAGQTSASITITVVNDTLDEADESVIVSMGNPVNATPGVVTVSSATIRDDDAAPSLQFTSAEQSVLENAGTATITVQLSAVSGLDVTVPFSAEGTATNPADYTISESPLVIPAGQTTGTITVTIVNDAEVEDAETVLVNLATPTNASLGATTVHTLTILDNDGVDALSVYDPVNSQFYVRNTVSWGNADAIYGFGVPGAGWQPIYGDWNGDGVDTAGLYDPATSQFYLTNDPTSVNLIVVSFGAAGAGWKPVAGDWDGDGIDTVGLYDPKGAVWFLTNSLQGGNAEVIFGYGAPDSGWQPVAGDWNGDKHDTVALYDPASSVWYLNDSLAAAAPVAVFGYGMPDSGASPLAGDWNADGHDTVGLYDPRSSAWLLSNVNAAGNADVIVGFGAPDAGWRTARGASDLLTQIIDNGANPGFSTVGDWTASATGFRGDAVRNTSGTGADTANWSFWVLPGQYNVYATWTASSDLSNAAPFTVYNGDTSLSTVKVNERTAPSGLTDQGTAWKSLGTFDITGDTLKVTLSDNTTRSVEADAIRIQRVADVVLAGWE